MRPLCAGVSRAHSLSAPWAEASDMVLPEEGSQGTRMPASFRPLCLSNALHPCLDPQQPVPSRCGPRFPGKRQEVRAVWPAAWTLARESGLALAVSGWLGRQGQGREEVLPTAPAHRNARRPHACPRGPLPRSHSLTGLSFFLPQLGAQDSLSTAGDVTGRPPAASSSAILLGVWPALRALPTRTRPEQLGWPSTLGPQTLH